MAAQKIKCLIAVKLFVKRLQNHLHFSRKLDLFREFDCEEMEAAKEKVPDDVKEGQFAVFAKNEEGKPIRFVVELCALKHPAFLRLLKMAEDEYGFEQSGALAIPCQPEELRRILQQKIY